MRFRFRRNVASEGDTVGGLRHLGSVSLVTFSVGKGRAAGRMTG
jgi:hypothetical protein